MAKFNQLGNIQGTSRAKYAEDHVIVPFLPKSGVPVRSTLVPSFREPELRLLGGPVDGCGARNNTCGDRSLTADAKTEFFVFFLLQSPLMETILHNRVRGKIFSSSSNNSSLFASLYCRNSERVYSLAVNTEGLSTFSKEVLITNLAGSSYWPVIFRLLHVRDLSDCTLRKFFTTHYHCTMPTVVSQIRLSKTR